MNKVKKKKKSDFICIKCEFHEVENDTCTAKDIKECSKKDVKECDNFLVKHKLVMY